MNTPFASGRVTELGHATAESSHSSVSWAAILAGAVAAAALALILLALGAGLGFASLSPWSQSGAPAVAVGIGTAVWLWLVQVITSGLGGYLTGRLRTRWVDLHTHEVRFRDTAHGLAMWSVAALLGVGLTGTAITSLIGAAGSAVKGTAEVAGTVAAAGAGAAGAAGAKGLDTDYLSDTLLRSDMPPAQDDGGRTAPEIGRILTTSFARGDVSMEDRTYLARLVARRTGLDQAQAEQRVDQVLAQARTAKEEAERKAKEAADVARKSASLFAFWGFISLLSGAFAASAMAAYGGRLRDDVTHHDARV